MWYYVYGIKKTTKTPYFGTVLYKTSIKTLETA